MKAEEARYYVKMLQENYGKSFGTETLKRAQNDLLAINLEAMEAAADYILKNYNFLPTIEQVMKAANIENQKILTAKAIIREGEAAKEKHEYKKIDQFQGITDFGKACCMLLQVFTSGKIEHKRYMSEAIQIAKDFNKREMLDGLMSDYKARYGAFVEAE